MAGIVADYKSVKEGRVRMGVGADTDRSFEFSLPEVASDDLPMVLTFLLVSSNDLHMRIELNGVLISDRSYSNGAERSIQEIATGVSIPFGNRNILTVTVVEGEVMFSDVVLWFQRNASGGDDVIGSGFDIDVDPGGDIQSGLLIVADYKAVKVGRIRLGVGADTDRTVEFDLPVAPRSETPMIVTFLLVSSNDLHMRIQIDGTEISDREYTNGAERCIQELADRVALPPGNRHSALFQVVRGEVLLSDVILWFQRTA